MVCSSASEASTETANDIDDDCDGQVDENFVYMEPDGTILNAGDSCGLGACAGGVVEADDEGVLVCSSADSAEVILRTQYGRIF